MSQKIKSEKQVREHLAHLLCVKEWTPSQLAQKIALQKCDAKDVAQGKTAIKVHLSKWLNQKDRYPGTECLYYLSQAFGVSMESILLCSGLVSKDDATLTNLLCESNEANHPTLFGIAQSKNAAQIERDIQALKQSTGLGLGDLVDEYQKNILDYVIEFQNFVVLKTLVDGGLLAINKNTDIDLLCEAFCDQICPLLKLIVRAGSVDVFDRLVPKTMPWECIDGRHWGVGDEPADAQDYRSWQPFMVEYKPSLWDASIAPAQERVLRVDRALLEQISCNQAFCEYFLIPHLPSFEECQSVLWLGVQAVQNTVQATTELSATKLKEWLMRLGIDLSSIFRYSKGFYALMQYLVVSDCVRANKFLEKAISHTQYLLEIFGDSLVDKALQRPECLLVATMLGIQGAKNGQVLPILKVQANYLAYLMDLLFFGKYKKPMPDNKYYIVACKGGHVGREQYKLIFCPVLAKSGKEAAKAAREMPRVKHDHPDAIKSVQLVSQIEYLQQLSINHCDGYFRCKSKKEQRVLGSLAHIYQDKYNTDTRKKKEPMHKPLYYKRQIAKKIGWYKLQLQYSMADTTGEQ